MEPDDPQHLPVFIQPSEINFVLGKPETHKCLLTIFNPYPFGIRFRVLCNAPSKYTVGLTKGTIRPGCYLDTTIRHKSPTTVESDCLRIEIYRTDEGTHPCGVKELPLNVLSSNPNMASRLDSQRLMEFTAVDESFSSSSYGAFSNRSRAIPSLAAAARSRDAAAAMHQHDAALPHQQNTPNFYWLAVLSFLFCVSVLLLPQFVDTESETKSREQQQYSWIPHWIRPTQTSKCVSAYVLGILTVYFFLQPTA